MKLEQLASSVFGHFRAMDCEATTIGRDGVPVGLWHYGAHVCPPRGTEVSWSAEVASRLESDGCDVRTEEGYRGTRQRCDLLVDLEDATRIWIEVKGSWHNWWKGNRSKARQWLMDQVMKDMNKVAGLTASEATHVGLVLLGFDDPDSYPMDEDFQDMLELTKLSTPPWQSAKDEWPDPHRAGNRVRCWFWWRPVDQDAGPPTNA